MNLKSLIKAVVAAMFGGGVGMVQATELNVGAGETVTYEAKDAAAVQALTQITFADAEGCVELKGGTFTLGATVSGAGTVKALSAAELTISGDSSGFLGQWDFSNSVVVVTSRHGLGDANTPMATSRATTDTKKDSPGGGWCWLTFEGEGLTNDVPLTTYGSHSFAKAGAGPFVQKSLLTIYPMNGTTVMYIDFVINTDCTFEQGIWLNDNLNKWPRPYIVRGCTLKLPFLNAKGRTIYVNPEGSGGSGRARLELTGTGNNWGALHVGANVCVATSNAGELVNTMAINLTANSSCLDLGGLSQTVKSVVYSGTAPTAASKETSGAVVTSAEPATLTVAGANTEKHNLVQFEGKASFRLATTSDETVPWRLSKLPSSTSGDLTVDSGKMILEWGARWCGENAVVNGGTLQLDSTDSFLNDSTALTLTSPGHLALGTDVTACFSAATIAGATIAKGTYTVAQLEAAYPATAGLVTGSGSISVNEHEPEIPPYVGDLVIDGTTATVPKSATVFLSAADIARIAPLTSIVFGNSLSRIVCANETGTMAVSAALSGPGEFCALSSAGLTLSGDNSAFAGSFLFSNSVVTATSRYGLGGANTVGVTSYAGSQANPLTLTGAAQTCDVPVTVKDTHTFSTEPDEEIVFTKLFTLMKPTSGSYGYVNVGNVDFRGGFKEGGTWPTVQLAEDRTAKLKDVSAAGKWLCLYSNAGSAKGRVFRLSGNNVWGDGRLNLASLICDSANCLGTSGQAFYFTSDSDVFVDLNGFDQNAALYWGASGTKNGSAVTNSSATAATFTINGTPTEKHNPIRFVGNLSLVYDSTATWHLSKMTSAPSGALTVRRGVFDIEDNAEWRGPEVLVDGGTLSVTSAKAFTDDTTALEVRSGTLSVAANVTAYFKSAKIGATTLASGVYDVAQLATTYPGLVAGAGTLAVGQNTKIDVVNATWTGATGDGKLTTDANWLGGKAPDLFSGGANITFASTYGQANVDQTGLAVYGLHFASAQNFTLGGANALGLGKGGISSVNADPGLCPVVTNAITAPLEMNLAGVGDFSVGAGSVLSLDGTMSGGATAQEIGVGGTGVLRLSGDNAGLNAKLVLTNLETRVYSSTALGSPARQTQVRGSAFRIHSAEIDTPLAVKGYGIAPADPYVTRKDIERVFAEPGQKVLFRRKLSSVAPIAGAWLLNDITCVDGIEGMGGFLNLVVDPGYVGRLQGGALTMVNSNGQYPITFSGNGTMELAVTNNVWHRLLAEGTGTVVRCLSAGTLLETSPVCFGYRETLYNGAGRIQDYGPSGSLDLNGFDQVVSYLSHEKKLQADPDTIVRTAGWCGVVTSAVPATLTLTGLAGSGNTYKMAVGLQAAVAFRGLASLTLSAADGREQKLLFERSDSKGTLKVTGGTLTLAEGAGWFATTNVVICGTGVLKIDATSAPTALGRVAGRSRAHLTVADAGSLFIPSGSELTVKSLRLSAVADAPFVAPGVYAGTDYAFITGGGKLRVLKAGETGLSVVIR